MRLVSRREYSRSADGRVWSRGMGAAIWNVTLTTSLMERGPAASLLAQLAAIEEYGGVFTAYDLRNPLPSANPAFSTVGAEIAAVGADRRSLSITGLVAGHVISPGDYVAFDHGGNRWLHRFSGTATANGSGVAALAAVVPAIVPGVGAGKSVDLKRATAQFVIEPGSVQSTDEGGLLQAVTWAGVQHIE